MITESSRNIMRSALNYANANTSQFMDWNMQVSLLNTEYRKLYDDICSHTLDFVKTINVPGRQMLLPPDCYRIMKVEVNGWPVRRSSIQNETGYNVINEVLHLYGCSNAKLTYSTIPDTLTAPDKAILIENTENIPTDKKNYFVVANRDGTYTFNENKTTKYLGKDFEWDLDTFKLHDIWNIVDNYYNADLSDGEIPEGERVETNPIGDVKYYSDNFYVGTTTTHTVQAYRIGNNYYNSDFTPSIKPVGTKTDETSIGYYKNVNYSVDNPVYWLNGTYRNADFSSTTEPEGTVDPSRTVELGTLSYTSTDVVTYYTKVESDWYLVTAMSPTGFVYDDTDPVTDPDVIAELEGTPPIVARYKVYVNSITGWINKDSGNYFKVVSFADSGEEVTSTQLTTYLDTLEFDEAVLETYIAYSTYKQVIAFTATEVVTLETPVTDTTVILALDEITADPVTYQQYREEVEQKFIWDEADVSDLIVREGTLVTNLQMHSPYMMISYSDGLILIYTGWRSTVWNYNIIFGHETNGEIVALKTDDTTGKGCVWHNSDDDQYYYASFVPDTVLSYPTTALFTLMTYRLAAHIGSLLGTADEYLIKELIPNAEAEFFGSLSYGNVATKMNDFRRRAYVV